MLHLDMSVGFWTFESWKSEYSCVRGEKWCLVLLFEINVVVLHPVNLYAYVRAKINVVNCKELAVKTSFFCVKFHQNDGSTACCAVKTSFFVWNFIRMMAVQLAVLIECQPLSVLKMHSLVIVKEEFIRFRYRQKKLYICF